MALAVATYARASLRGSIGASAGSAGGDRY